MKKVKKRLLGFLAIAIVAIAGIVAYRAVNYNADAISSVTDEIIVKVYDKYPKVKFIDPESETILVGEKHTVAYEWENSQYADFTLSYNGVTVTTWHEDYGHFEPREHPTGNGSHEIFLNEYGKYVLSVVAVGEANQEFRDSIAIYRLSTSIAKIDENENNDPIFNIKYEDGVRRLELQVFDEETGNQVFPEPIYIDVEAGTDNLNKLIEMPLGTKTGKYTIYVNGLDLNGEKISDSSFTIFDYKSPLDVPDTGHNTKSLNIAQSDFLITGLLIFFVVTVAAIFILNCKQEQ